MQRIDGPTVSAALPAPQATGTGPSAPGFFGHGDPVGGVSPTVPSVDWANTIQEELVAVIAHAGIALDKTNNAQLLTALQQLFGSPAASTGSNTNGRWEKRPSGVIEQWGIVSGSFGEGSQPITFPMQFPNVCENLQVTAINASGGSNRDIWAEAQAWSKTGGTVFLNYVNASGVASCDGFFWTAKGN